METPGWVLMDDGVGLHLVSYRAGLGQSYGQGIYSTPSMKVADGYVAGKTFRSRKTGKTYYYIMQNRINPQKRVTPTKDYCLILVPEGTSPAEEKRLVEASIGPYGILIKEVSVLTRVRAVSEPVSEGTMPAIDRAVLLEALSALTRAEVKPLTKNRRRSSSLDELTTDSFLSTVYVTEDCPSQRSETAGSNSSLQLLTSWISRLSLNLALSVLTETSGWEKGLFVDLDEFLDPDYDYDFTDGSDSSECSRGGEPYTRPWGWYRFALKVKDKYPDGNAWLGTDGWRSHSSPGEWPVSFHGTSIDEARGITRSHYTAGPRQVHGRGIYSTPDIEIAEYYTMKKTFKSTKNGKMYMVIMQNRINPQKRVFTEKKDYWLIPVPKGTPASEEKRIVEESIRPYGILIKEVHTETSENDVLQLLESSNPTTCPLDPIPSTLLQSISLDLLPFISSPMNSSLSSGCVPQAFKTARVVPILKKPSLDSSDISSYRPNQLQDINQSGFKPAHSTETALIAVTERLHAARSAQLSSVLILLDLSAAFDTVTELSFLQFFQSPLRYPATDTVNHKILLSVLTDLGITGTAWKWFESYLEDRHYQSEAAMTSVVWIKDRRVTSRDQKRGGAALCQKDKPGACFRDTKKWRRVPLQSRLTGHRCGLTRLTPCSMRNSTARLENNTTRITEAEGRLSETEDKVLNLENNVALLETTVKTLVERAEDLENRSLRDNIRIMGFKEGAEGGQPEPHRDLENCDGEPSLERLWWRMMEATLTNSRTVTVATALQYTHSDRSRTLWILNSGSVDHSQHCSDPDVVVVC
ncbi:hypothetical protein NFI96_000279 [Prochilodus magdalenae]|nr:hypothetical protein NFI96_000279 [Prochilodus magdalenae]